MKTDTKNTLYPIQLWITSIIVIAPLLLAVVGLVNGQWNVGLQTIPIFIPFGLVLSLPVLFLSFLIFRFLVHKVASTLMVKVLFAAITIAGVVISFIILLGSMALMLSLIYSGSVIISSLVYKINKK